MSDAVLISGIQQGNHESLKQLFDLYYDQLTRYALKLVDHPESAEEIVQDIFVWVWEKRERLSIEASVKSYLLRATKNRCINHLKSKYNSIRKEEIADNMPINGQLESVAESLQYAELLDLLARAEELLPEKTAIVFSMSRHGDMSHQQIAEELDISVKTVEYHITNALKIIRSHLAQQGYTYPCIGFISTLAAFS
ncbi:MAG: RNA polymerase sigma-70 factor [Cyclobacteriaceae bacterium]|nr:RNA polymerase sigma-70 factor [Cyclobacteriaceae bacterium HetDA_MAG_MS6]